MPKPAPSNTSFRRPANFYHWSSAPLCPGVVLECRNRFNVVPDIEAALERNRPTDMLPRSRVVYMMSTLNDFGSFGLCRHGGAYRVFPSGKVRRHDASIIGMMQKAERFSRDRAMFASPVFDWADTQKVDQLAALYWSGQPITDTAKRPLWEYTAEAAIAAEIVLNLFRPAEGEKL